MLMAVLLLLLGFGFLVPAAAVLLPSSERRPLPVILVGAGMSIGFLTLLLWYVGSRWKPGFQAPVIVAVLAGCLVLGTVAVARSHPISFGDPRRTLSAALARCAAWPGRRDPGWIAATAAAVAIAASLLLATFDAVYYPFLTADTVSLYGAWARGIFQFGGLERFGVPGLGGEYNLYPLLVPLTFVYSYLVAGGVNEHLAKLGPAILAWLSVGATYYAGSVLVSARVGLAAAALMALTPLHARWASTGQTDVPTAYFFTMAWILFYQSLLRSGDRRLALASGAMAGLAMWTRSGGAVTLVCLALISALWVSSGRREGEWPVRRALGALLAASTAAFLVAGPWYLRGYLAVGHLLPDTGWTMDANRAWVNLLPFVGFWSEFGYLASSAYALGFAYCLWRSLPSGRGGRRLGGAGPDFAARVLLAVGVPYLLLWWFSFSYDARFLLMVLPALAIQAAWVLDALFLREMKSLLQVALVVAVLAVVAVPGLQATGGIHALENAVLRPGMDDDARRVDRMGAVYGAYLRVKELLDREPGARALTTLKMWSSYDAERFVGGLPRRLSELQGFQYLVVYQLTQDYYRREGAADNEVLRSLGDERLFRQEFEQDGFVVYRILGSG